MGKQVTQDAIRAARKADLYGFLLRHHDGDIVREGDSLRLRSNHSVTLKEGYSGWRDWSTDESGNAVDFLVNFLGYELTDAVAALCADMGISDTDAPHIVHAAAQQKPKPQTSPAQPTGPLELPPPVQGQYRQLYAYLTQARGIPAATVQRLIDDKILYQEAEHNNMVFVDPSHNFMELRGTNTYIPFHQVQDSTPAADAFWWFKAHGLNSSPTVAFICEASIDAISLYLLRKDAYPQENGLYCSIGGVANQQRIDAIKKGMAAAGLKAVLAVDNDEAGEKCRKRNPDLPYIVPTAKDWNEDLRNRTKKG